MNDMFSIGEFSKAAGLTVKTLRFYHEQSLLVPAFVDPETGYRYYRAAQIETARVIAYLRSVEFSVAEIRDLVRQPDDTALLEAMERQKNVLNESIKQNRAAVRSLEQNIAEERSAMAIAQAEGDPQEKTVPPILISGVRMRGHYSECGKGFAKIGRNFGRYICGTPFLLHYDMEYKEDDADFEACMPVKQSKTVDGINVRDLPGGHCVWLIHKGPYDQLGRSYARILKYIKDKGYQVIMPTREVYIKGPGMIFKGNPKNYLTEIQMLVQK